jgi:hypothetical protein
MLGDRRLDGSAFRRLNKSQGRRVNVFLESVSSWICTTSICCNSGPPRTSDIRLFGRSPKNFQSFFPFPRNLFASMVSPRTSAMWRRRASSWAERFGNRATALVKKLRLRGAQLLSNAHECCDFCWSLVVTPRVFAGYGCV